MKLAKLINKLDNETRPEALLWFFFETPVDEIKRFIRKIRKKIYRSNLWMALKGERFIDYEYISRDLGYSIIDILATSGQHILDQEHCEVEQVLQEKIRKMIALYEEYKTYDDYTHIKDFDSYHGLLQRQDYILSEMIDIYKTTYRRLSW